MLFRSVAAASGPSGVVAERRDLRALAFTPPRLFIASQLGALLSVDVTTRAERWYQASPMEGSSGFAMTVAGNRIFLPFASGRMAVIDPDTGQPLAWLAKDDVRFDWPPAVVGGLGYLTSEDGLYGFRIGEL